MGPPGLFFAACLSYLRRMASCRLAQLLIPAGLATVIAGCAAASQIVMKNPRTDQVIVCQGDPWLQFNPWRTAEKCAEALERDGWKRLGSDKN